MIQKLIIYIICFFLSTYTYAQPRVKIDRSKQTVSQKMSNNSSSTKNNANTSKSSKRKTVSTTKKYSKRTNTKQGSSNTLSLSSTELSFDSHGGTKTVYVTSSKSWSIGAKTYSWGHLTTTSNAVTVKIDPNTSTNSRTDYFTIKSGNLEKTVNISQAGISKSNSITATITNVNVTNDVDVDGNKGLSIKVSFNVIGMKGHDGRISCYFYDSDGNALIDLNNYYGTNESTSHVAVSRSFTPSYDNSIYTDLEIKIPYDELHLSGTYARDLRLSVLLWDYQSGTAKEITRKDHISFYCIPKVSYLKVDGTTSNKSKYFGEDGGREYYSVSTSASSYETWGVPSWCSIENKTSSGFTLVCQKNTTRSSRSDWMLVKADGKQIKINIEQAAYSGPTATITSVEQEHNVFNGFNKGMNIKLKFEVSGMLGKTVKATAWFYYADNTTKLNNGYGGHVHVSNSDTAPYENTIFTMTLFMPYQGLNMEPGFHGDLSFDINITDNAGNSLVRKNNYSFNFRN